MASTDSEERHISGPNQHPVTEPQPAAQRDSGGAHEATSPTAPKEGRGCAGDRRDEPGMTLLQRRKEINRNSARRIRLRRVEETEDLRRQVAALRRENGMLLGYATTLRQDKREMEICNALLAAENLRLTARLQTQTRLALGSEQ